MPRASKIPRIHRSKKEIKRIVEGFKASDLSMSSYAKTMKVPQTSLCTWIHKSKLMTKGTRGDSSLIPVHLVEKMASSSPVFEVVLENNRVIKVPPGFDPDALAQILQIAES